MIDEKYEIKSGPQLPKMILHVVKGETKASAEKNARMRDTYANNKGRHHASAVWIWREPNDNDPITDQMRAAMIGDCEGMEDRIRNSSRQEHEEWLMLAAANGHHEFVSQLIGWALHFNQDNVLHAKDLRGRTVLMLAAANGHFDVIEVLLSSEVLRSSEGLLPDCNAKNASGNTALMLAAANGHSKAVETLLRNPYMDLNLQNKDGDTALMLAVKNGHREVVQQLLTQPGIDLYTKNKQGQTVLMLAGEKKGHTDIAQVITKHCADKMLAEIKTINRKLDSCIKNAEESEVEDALEQLRSAFSIAEERLQSYDNKSIQHKGVIAPASEDLKMAWKTCQDAVNSTKSVLNNPTWTSLFENLALTLTGIGILLTAASLINRGINGHYLFFKSDTEELIEDSEKWLTAQRPLCG